MWIDVTAPVIPIIANATGECSVTVTAPTTTDNCIASVTGTTTSPLTYSAQGTYTIVWTFDDGNGNTSTANQTVIVDDITAPVVPIIANATGECSVTVTAPTTTDNCIASVTGTTTSPLTYSVQGTYTIVWTFDDGNGNTSTANQTVIVDDVTAPVVPTIADATGECSVTVTAPTTTDNCIASIIGTTTSPLTYSAQGTYTIVWTFNDGNGNTSTANQTVIVDDVTAPIVPIIANATGECSVTVTAPTTTDNCIASVTGTTTSPLTYSVQGTYTIVWTFDDGNGNTSTANQTVIVDDVTAPVVPIIANATGECSVTVTAPTATDNCIVSVTGTTTSPLTYSAQGTYTIVWTFDDGNGNTSTANQTVIVDDVTTPVVPTIADATGECSVTVTPPTTTDNCIALVTGTTTSPLTYSVQGTYTIVWTFDDGNGNTSTANQTVIVDDVTAPVVPTIADATGECSVTVTAPTTTDNCIASIIGTTTSPLTYSAQGTYTIVWTFNDGNGNTSTANQTVIVDDVTAPIVPIIANATGECSVTVTAPTTTDNCIASVTGTTTSPLTYSVQGTYTIVWTFDDGNGNTSTANQTVIVDDVTAPVVPIIANATGECSVTVTAPTATDNCIVSVTGTTTSPLTYSAQGTYTIVWTFDDGNGNTSTANQTVIVDDVTTPVVPTIADATGECSVTVTPPTTTDNCIALVTGTTTSPLTYSVQGTYTIVWTFDDGNGNTSTANQTVIVDDVTAPVVPTIANATGECSVTVTAPTTTDNCIASVTGTTTSPLTYSVQGTYTIVWTFDDGNGNTSTANQTVIVDDVTAPVVPTIADATGECSVTVTAPTTTDNCIVSVTGTTTSPLTYSLQGTYTIVWTFDDGNGNTSTANQTVIVDDVTAPVVPTIADATGECSVTVTAPTTTDNCIVSVIGTTTSPLTYSVQGTYTIVWTFNDGNGNTSTANQTVIVDDVTAPVVPIIANATGECSVTVTPPTTTDNCVGTVTGTTTSPLIYNTQGTYTIIWTFDDGNGNTSTANQTVIVKDVTPPTIGTVEPISIAVNAASCSATLILTTPTTSDNCIVQSVTNNAPSVFPLGTTTVTWTVTDGVGLTATTTQSVTVTTNLAATSVNLESPAICTGQSTNLSFTITGGLSPYTVVYNVGSTPTSVNNYVSGAPLSISPSANTTYALVSVTDAYGCQITTTTLSAMLTVNPLPSASNTTGVTCSGTSIGFDLQAYLGTATSNFTWYVLSDNPSVSGEPFTPQSGSMINTVLTTTSQSPQAVVYRVTPTSILGCLGSTFDVTITVFPVPNISAVSKTICSGTSTKLSVTNPNGVYGTNFNWTAIYGAVTGGEGSAVSVGFGTNAINETLINATSTSIDVIYTLTPIGTGPTFCTGTPLSVTVTVSPTVGTPILTGPTVLCQNDADATYIATATNNTSITYSVSPLAAGVMNATTGVMNWDESFSGPVTIMATATGCNNSVTTQTLSVMVNPNPIITIMQPEPVCISFDLQNTLISPNILGGTYTYYATLANAISKTTPLSSSVVNTSNTYYTRYELPTGCFTTGSISVTVGVCVEVRAKAVLQGAYNTTLGLMNNTLWTAGFVPSTDPYTTATYNGAFVHVNSEPTPKTISPSAMLNSGSDAIVDWVFIELRDKNNPTQVLGTSSALIQRDGDIVDMDGVSAVKFRMNLDQYYVVVRHRNHLGVMTASTIDYHAILPPPVIDFTSASTLVYTNTALASSSISNYAPRKVTSNGIMALWSGNANISANGLKNVSYNGPSNDRSSILTLIGTSTPLNIVTGYYKEDLNMDSNVSYNGQGNDRAIILSNLGSSFPNNIIQQHFQ